MIFEIPLINFLCGMGVLFIGVYFLPETIREILK